MSKAAFGLAKNNQSKNPPHLIAGLDIGSSKVTLVVGIYKTPNPNESELIEIVGVGTAAHAGLKPGIKQGVVVNIEATTEAIRKAREEAELMSGYQIHEVWIGISGSHTKSFDSKGMVAIKNKEVNATDVERVIDAAKAVAVPMDRTVLHVIPREYKVDGQEGILDPIGMSGIRLESNVHIVTGLQSAITNNIKCVEKAGLHVSGLVLDQLASSLAVLSEDEKALGVCAIDMGAGSCHLVYYVNGSVAHTSVIPVGGAHFTHDIAVGLRTPQNAAEILKIKHGCAMTSLVGEEDAIEVEGVGGRNSRNVRKRDLAEVIEPRAEEVLDMIKRELQQSGLLGHLGSGVVLTGGCSEMQGIVELGEFILDLPVRKGVPTKVGGLKEVVHSAKYASAVGLVLYGLSKTKMSSLSQESELFGGALNEAMSDFGKKIKKFIWGEHV